MLVMGFQPPVAVFRFSLTNYYVEIRLRLDKENVWTLSQRRSVKQNMASECFALFWLFLIYEERLSRPI